MQLSHRAAHACTRSRHNHTEELRATYYVMISQIITHPGGAHKDDFLACCVLAAQNQVPISRREPTPQDLADPTICVVDVGDEHAPERNNFDHHQFPRDHTPICALSLVLQNLGLYDDARRFCDWLEPAEWFDCRGPARTADWLEVDRSVVNKLVSPIDIALLRRFADCAELAPEHTLYEVMTWIGGDLVDYLETLRTRLAFVAEHVQILPIDVAGQRFQAAFMPRTKPLLDDPSTSLARFLDARHGNDDTIGLIYPDRRGGGYGLSRLHDDPRLDFTQIGAEPDVHFAHASGFVAKVSAHTPERLQALMAQAYVPVSG